MGLLEQDGVGVNRDVRRELSIELKLRCEGGAIFDDIGEEGAEIDWRAVEGEATAISERQEEQFLKDGFEVMNLVEETGVNLLLRGIRRGGVEGLR